MEVLPPSSTDPSIPNNSNGDEQGDEVVQSPRTRHLVGHLLQRVLSLSRKQNVVVSCKEITVKKAPYSAVEQNPSCPYVFQMPLHYPRYTKEEYESMPEWQLDRLLEEYGLPVSGSLSEKREYAIGSFVWRS